jgi:competence protein ComFC
MIMNLNCKTSNYNKTRNSVIEILGSWRKGWALDLHTYSSRRLPGGSFDNEYSNIGFALNRVKYGTEHHRVYYLADEAAAFIRSLHVPLVDALLIVPPSEKREFQPVQAIAKIISAKTGVILDERFIRKQIETEPLKGVNDPEERRHLLENSFALGLTKKYRGKDVLLFDDLYRSGSTLNVITDLLYSSGEVKNVYCLTLTKTRSKV